MQIDFMPIAAFERGVMFRLLSRAYAFDPRYEAYCSEQWRFWDDFFFDHPSVCDSCGFITAVAGQPIGFVVWDPRPLPHYVEIGNNCIIPEYKGKGLGAKQISEALRRIDALGPAAVRVRTSEPLIAAQRMYERAGFVVTRRWTGLGSDFSNAYIDYERRVSPANSGHSSS